METGQVDVGAIIDSANFFWRPFGIAAILIVVMLTDGFDLFIPSYVATALVREWGVSRVDVQPFVQAGLIGMAIGSIVLGWTGDRIGRKTAYLTGLALMGAGSGLCYQANSIPELFAWRLVMGLGLGGITPLATTLVAEWTNRKMRSIVVAAVIVSIPLGGTLAGTAYRTLEPLYGWRSMFAVGAVVPLILILVFVRVLPESPKYMARHRGLHRKLAESLNRLVGENRFRGDEEFYVSEGVWQPGNWLGAILNNDYRSRTVLIWIAFAFNSFVLYVFTGEIPLLLTAAKVPADASSLALQSFSFGAIAGSIGGATLIGWLGSRYTGTALAASGCAASVLVATVLMADSVSLATLLALCLVAGASVNGLQAFLYAVAAHSYPTEVRGSAVGMAQTMSRIGAVVSPLIAGIYFGMDPMPSVSVFFLFMAGVAVITVVTYYSIPSHIPRAGASRT